MCVALFLVVSSRHCPEHMVHISFQEQLFMHLSRSDQMPQQERVVSVQRVIEGGWTPDMS